MGNDLYVRDEDEVINSQPNKPKADIDLGNYQDLEFLKNLYRVVEAYQILSNVDQRDEYIQMIRLRSFVCQYINLSAAEKDGHIFPFMLFSVQENKQNNINADSGQSRMIELNFVDDVLNDRLKDHENNSHHISMVEKVVKGFRYDEFIIEL